MFNMRLPCRRIHHRTILPATAQQLTHTRRYCITERKHCIKIHLILCQCQWNDLQLLPHILFRIPYPMAKCLCRIRIDLHCDKEPVDRLGCPSENRIRNMTSHRLPLHRLLPRGRGHRNLREDRKIVELAVEIALSAACGTDRHKVRIHLKPAHLVRHRSQVIDGKDCTPQNPLEVHRQLIPRHLDFIVLIIGLLAAAAQDKCHIVRDLTPFVALAPRILHLIRLRQELLKSLSCNIDLYRCLERWRGSLKCDVTLL